MDLLSINSPACTHKCATYTKCCNFDSYCLNGWYLLVGDPSARIQTHRVPTQMWYQMKGLRLSVIFEQTLSPSTAQGKQFRHNVPELILLLGTNTMISHHKI